MKIIELNVRNLRKISAIDITPKDNIVEIEGRNNQGKSTILDGILYALAGGKIPTGVIKSGEEKAEITVKFDKYIVKKTITDSNAYLTVTTNDGLTRTSPQTFLSSLIGKIAFDPLEFMRQDEKEQATTIKKILGIEDKINKLSQEETEIMEDRRIVKRDLSQINMDLIANIEDLPEPDPSSEIISELQSINEKRNMLVVKQEELRSLDKEKEAIKSEVHQIRNRLQILEARMEEVEEESKKYEEYNFDYIKNSEQEIEVLKNKLQKHQEEVQKYNEYKKRIEIKDRFVKLKNENDDLTGKIESIREYKEKLLSSSELPIEGLELTEEGLTYEGNSMQNTCQSLKIKISIALAMKVNPDLKIILIRDGSLLDAESIDEIRQIAKQEDFQVWIEKVCDEPDGDGSIYIEEGEIK